MIYVKFKVTCIITGEKLKWFLIDWRHPLENIEFIIARYIEYEKVYERVKQWHMVIRVK